MYAFLNFRARFFVLPLRFFFVRFLLLLFLVVCVVFLLLLIINCDVFVFMS